MNTPAHVACSLLLWRRQPGWGSAIAVTTGALLPDLPMYGFYGYQKTWALQTERAIWSTLYFQDGWQLFFDAFNSIPLAILLIAVCKLCGFRLGLLCAASALLHMACDFPLHHDDAHRHFLPISNWRFASPISYWDPAHFGHVFVWLELVLAIGACAVVGRFGPARPMRVMAFITLAIYFAGILFAIVMWMPI